MLRAFSAKPFLSLIHQQRITRLGQLCEYLPVLHTAHSRYLLLLQHRLLTSHVPLRHPAPTHRQEPTNLPNMSEKAVTAVLIAGVRSKLLLEATDKSSQLMLWLAI